MSFRGRMRSRAEVRGVAARRGGGGRRCTL